MTQAQKNDIDCIKWFYEPAQEATFEEEQAYLAHSEKGIKCSNNPLVEGKRWRGINVHELYEPGVLSGDMPYFVLLGGYTLFNEEVGGTPDEITPRYVVDFLKKEMFKGTDADIIEHCYQEIIYENRY